LGWNCSEKSLVFACSRSWYLATTTSICWWRSENIHLWVLPDHNSHRSSLVQVQDQVSIERNQNMQCIQILGSAKALVRWNRDHLGWKSHDSNQTSAFTVNVCAFEVKTDCRLQLRHGWLFLFWCTSRLLQAPGKCNSKYRNDDIFNPKVSFQEPYISFFKCFLCTFFVLNTNWGLQRCFVMYQWNLLWSVYSETEHLQF
jgi:hypothetical protein